MAKKKIIRKSNRLFAFPSNYYSWGGDFTSALGGTKPFDLGETFSGGNVASMLKSGLASGLGSATGNIIGGAIGGNLKSGAGSAISNAGGIIGGAVSAVNPILGGIVSAGTGIVGGLVNRMFGSNINEDFVNRTESLIKAQNNYVSGASDNASLLRDWGFHTKIAGIKRSDVGSDGWFSDKAKNIAKRLNRQADEANLRARYSLENTASNIDALNDLNILANYSAYGGPLGFGFGMGGGAIGYELAKEDLGIKELNALNKSRLVSLPNSFSSPELNTFADGGKIHIKPENRGKFTKYCGGKVTSECIEKGKRSSDPAVRKRAVFAANSRKWKHADGGLMSNGAEWDNGLTYVGNGGTHEENPLEGVPMGIDAEGTPNLVEQGEVIFNDYVFSNRLFADSELLGSVNLPKAYDGYSFAAIAESLGSESKERPNDPISRRGLLSSMSRLQKAQETVRQDMKGKTNKKYDFGGKLLNGIVGMFDSDQAMYNADVLAQRDRLTHKNPMASPADYLLAYGGRKANKFDGRDTDTMFLDGENYGDWEDFGVLAGRVNAEDFWNTAFIDNGKNDGGKKGNNENSGRSSKLTWLRYAPVVGSAIGLGQNLFSRPDYTSANTILEAANQAGEYMPIGYTPIGNYLQYKPLDRDYYINKLNAQAGATRRAVMNTSSPSRNAALLAADYNAQGRLGDLARQAEEYNLAQRQAVETFNRGTNMANAEMGLKAAMANQDALQRSRNARLSGVAQAMATRDAVNTRRNASLSANLTNLFDSLGNIGIDAYNREDRDKLIRAGVFGILSEKPQEWSDKRWEDYKKAVSGKGYKCGGKLKKKRGGFTY